MRILKTGLLLIIIQTIFFAQSGWFQLNHGISSSIFYDVFFLNENTGFVVGPSRISKTTNAGLNWISVFSTTNNLVFYSIHSFNGSMIAAVGYGGSLNPYAIIYISNNGGSSWYYVYSPSAPFESYYCIRFATENTGIAVGSNGLIVRTTNSGFNWEPVDLNLSANLFKIQFLSSQSGYISGSYVNLKTTNGGLNWNWINGPGGTLSFIDINTGYENYYSGLQRTTNGGATWQMIFQMSNYMYNLSDLCFINYNTGYAVGMSTNSGPVIIKTTNSGYNWYSQYDNTNVSLHSVVFVNENTGYTVGSFNNAVILKTTNGGGSIGIQPISNEIPRDFSLSQNYPNPFNPVTRIRFSIPLSKEVSEVDGLPAAGRGVLTKLLVFDVLGREVAFPVNEELKPGVYEIDFDALSLPSGVYYYRLASGSFSQTKKMVLLK
jgi:photosystem II stability/assembly factor-like uncharacterized protein